MKRGRFITIEGIDGTGKSTQLAMLGERMILEGYDVVQTKEPGSQMDSSGLGSAIRRILFHEVTTQKMAPGVADCLFLADHLQHVGTVVEPALAEGKVVLSDRYSDSEFAYSVSAKNTPGYMLEAYTAGFGPMPDVTILLVATDPASMLARARNRKGIQAQEGKSWNDLQQQIAIQNEYLSRLVGQPRTLVLTVTPEQTPGQIFEILWTAIQDYLVRPVEYIEGENSKVISVNDTF